jgi:hypothetical protein
LEAPPYPPQTSSTPPPSTLCHAPDAGGDRAARPTEEIFGHRDRSGVDAEVAFSRPWHQTEGMLGSIMDLLGLDLAVPDESTRNRGAAQAAAANGAGWTSLAGMAGYQDVIPTPESSDLSLVTVRVGKSWFSMPCYRSELIGSGMNRSWSVPSRVRVRVCRRRWAPFFDHCICYFLAKRLLTTRSTADSAKAVEMISPWSQRSL